jgi:hypothetical protein
MIQKDKITPVAVDKLTCINPRSKDIKQTNVIG